MCRLLAAAAPMRSTGSGAPRLLFSSSRLYSAGSTVAARGPRCSAACELFPDQGANPSLLHWQADSLPVSHQRSPLAFLREVFHMIKIGYCQKVAASLRWSILLCRPQSLLLSVLDTKAKMSILSHWSYYFKDKLRIQLGYLLYSCSH